MRSLGLVLILVAIPGLTSADANLPGDKREPRCEKRSNTDPGRLNINSNASLYGLYAPPCKSSLDFYIAHNTLIRSASGRITIYAENEELYSYDFHVKFNEPVYGLYRDRYEIPSQENKSCSELDVKIDTLECRDIEGIIIDCPVTRLKTSMAFNDLLVDENAINVCFDN
jgi:hypothetical protein